MKRFIIQYKIIGVILLLVSLSTFSQPMKKIRNISKTFHVGAETEIQVNNKYGNIQLIPWEKDSVRFDIVLEVIDLKEVRLNSIFDYIDFDFTVAKHFIVAQTTFANQGSFWADVKDLANTLFAKGSKTQIDYTIYLPSNSSVKLNNKYGDIFISDHNGQLNINLSNGDLKSHALNGETTIKLQFSNANINYIKEGDLDISYHSEIQVNEVDTLNIISRSSRISIEKSGFLEINSSRDKYYLESVNNIIAKNSFSYMEIRNLGSQIELDANYGDLIIKKMSEAVSQIRVDGESTDISIYKDENQSINLEVIYNEKTGLYFSEELKNKETIKIEDKKLVKTSGILGNTEGQIIKVRASMLSGKLKIKDK